MAPTQPTAAAVIPSRALNWDAVVAGALTAAALAFVLHAFAAAIGIAVSSASPTWRDYSVVLQVLSGLYLVLVAIISLGCGGYIAGRLRETVPGSEEEIEFRDGAHGIAVWALAVVLTVILAWVSAQTATRLIAPSAGQSGTAQSVAGENIIAFDLDRLFRADKRPQNADLTYARSEAARILLTAAGHSGVTTEDRAYLIRLTSANTGLAGPEAEKRVDTIVSQARDNIRKARRSAVIVAFMAGAAALLGAAIAWFAAVSGGEHRDGRTPLPSSGFWRTARRRP